MDIHELVAGLLTATGSFGHEARPAVAEGPTSIRGLPGKMSGRRSANSLRISSSFTGRCPA